MFFRVNGGSVAEKSWLTCATGAGVVSLAWNLARTARAVELKVPGGFFSSLLLLCYCVWHVPRHLVHWNWCVKAMCSTVPCCNSNGYTIQSVQFAVEWLRQGCSNRICSSVTSTLDSWTPGRLFNWEGAIEVSDYDYWRSTPLINKRWFTNPGLALESCDSACGLQVPVGRSH